MNTQPGETATRDLQWQAQTLRITTLGPSGELAVPQAWAQVIGAEPETTATRKGLEQRAEGEEQGHVVSLAVRPDRIDWVLRARQPDEPPEDPLSLTLGGFTEALASLTGIGARWMASQSCPSAQRLALGGVLLAPVEDRQDGYRKLSAYLPPVQISPEGARDFFYQINRPRVTGKLGFGLSVNRLCKWSVAESGFLLLPMGSVSKRARNHLQLGTFCCRLELDINTDSDFDGELRADQMGTLLLELASYATELSQEGDKP